MAHPFLGVTSTSTPHSSSSYTTRPTTHSHRVIGSSKYADRLRKQVVAAARDPLRGPVLVVGEAGMCPDHVATLIHYASTMLKGESTGLHSEAGGGANQVPTLT